jgi:HK97 family phage major capsid protein
MDPQDLLRIITASKEALGPKLKAYDDLVKAAVDKDGNPRAFTGEEFTAHENIGKEINGLNSQILTAQSALQATRLIEATDDRTAEQLGLAGRDKLPHAQDSYREDFLAFVKSDGKDRSKLEAHFAGDQFLNITGTSPSTGSVLIPRILERTILQEAAKQSPLLMISNVRNIATRLNQIPFISDIGVMAPRSEAEAYSLTEPTIAGKNLDIFNFGGLIPVSIELMEDAEELERSFGSVWGRALADTVEEYGLKGTGGQVAFKNLAGSDVTLTITGKVPPGILTLGSGIVPSIAAAAHNALGYDDIVKVKQGVTASARANGVYLLGNDAETRCLLLKDTTGRPIWMPSLVAGQPATLNGSAYYVSDRIADVAATAVSMLFGDFAGAHQIAIKKGLTIKRSDHFYFGNGMVAFAGDVRMGALVGRNLAIAKLTHPANPG